MNILYLEPFYSGSHKSWIDSYKLFSKHNIDVIELPGRKWKWRMHGGAITLAKDYNKLDKKFNLILNSAGPQSPNVHALSLSGPYGTE